MRSHTTPLSAVVLLTLSSCATTPAARPTTPNPGEATTATSTATAPGGTNETPAQVVARLLSAEGTTALTPQQIDVGGTLHLVGHGTAAATVTHEGEQFQIALPVGAAEPVRCIVFNESIDPANALRRVYENLRHENADMEIRSVGAGFVGDTPHLDAQALYVVGPAERRLLGHVKFRVFNVHERGFVCLHDEPGFAATFDRATRPLLEVAAQTPRPYRYVLTLDGSPCGWMTGQTATARNETTDVTLTSFLIARSAQEMVASDHVTIERYNRAGEISEERIVENDDAAESNYLVRRTATPRRYHVEGRHLGRDIAGDFTAASALIASNPASARAYRALTAPRAPATVNILGYAGDSPLTATTETYGLERVVDARRAWLTQRTGEVQARMLVGSEGIADEVSVALAGRALAFRLVTE